jgi:methanol corrinoid protein
MRPFTLGYVTGLSFNHDPGRVLKIISDSLSDSPDSGPAPEKISTDALLPKTEPYKSVARAVIEGRVLDAAQLTSRAIEGGTDPLAVASDGLLKGMDAISVLYNHKQAYVPEILLAARALNAGLGEIGGSADALGRKGTVIMHTADGDLHDIGKNIVMAIVEANGYRVIDLGTSVETSRVVEAVKKHKPLALLGSSLMTSTRNAFLSTADVLKQEGINVPFIIGGGACDSSFAGQRDNLRYARDPEALVKTLDALTAGGKIS